MVTMRSLRLKTKTLDRIFAGIGLVGLMLLPSVVHAATPATDPKAKAQTSQQQAKAAVNQAYGITGDVQQGMIVMLDPKNSKNVAPLSNKNDTAMAGVVVPANESAVSLSGDGSTSQVFVGSDGKYNVLVSSQNGPIKVGDLVSISALDGIGMKADEQQSVILGKALVAFDGKNKVNGSATLSTSAGELKVAIGLVQVDVGVTHNPLAPTGTDSKVPQFLRKLAESIAGKPVDAARIYVCVALLVVTLVTASSLLYGGVRSSLISVGRNPMAKNSVLRGMVQVLFVGGIIFVIGLGVIYLLLKA